MTNPTRRYTPPRTRIAPCRPLRISTLILWLVAALVCLHLTIRSLRGRMTDAEDQVPE